VGDTECNQPLAQKDPDVRFTSYHCYTNDLKYNHRMPEVQRQLQSDASVPNNRHGKSRIETEMAMPPAGTSTSAEGEQHENMRILHSVRRIIRAADLDSRKLAAEHQITAPQLVSLMAVVEAEKTTAIEVARRVHLDPSTLVGVMDRLEGKGLIQKARDSGDRRQVWLVATDAGRALASRTPFPLQNAIDRALQQMSKVERKQVAACIERLAELMAVEDIDASPMLEIVAIGSRQHTEKARG
jgi:DNA-binding MarR family transcriptional regulator